MKLFGTDGVRGKAGVKVTAMSAMHLAMATGIYFKQFAKTKKMYSINTDFIFMIF